MKEVGKEDSKQKSMPSATVSKAPSTPEPNKTHSKLGPSVPNKTEETGKSQLLSSHQQQLQADSFKAKQMENHQLIKEAVEMKSVMDSMKQTGVDPTSRFKQVRLGSVAPTGRVQLATCTWLVLIWLEFFTGNQPRAP